MALAVASHGIERTRSSCPGTGINGWSDRMTKQSSADRRSACPTPARTPLRHEPLHLADRNGRRRTVVFHGWLGPGSIAKAAA